MDSGRSVREQLRLIRETRLAMKSQLYDLAHSRLKLSRI